MSLTPNQLAAVRELADVWPEARAVIIGATAIGFYYDMRWRQTADVDLVVTLEIADFPGALLDRPGWSRHVTNGHEFTSPLGVKMDLLPAGEQLLVAGKITWPSGNEMSLAGMDLAFDHAEPRDALDGAPVLVAPPPVVSVLKMASYRDRPTQRERDLQDIAHLLHSYVVDDDERRWSDAAGQEFELAPAYLLGLDIGRILTSQTHRRLVDEFMYLMGDPDGTDHALMRRKGPAAWRYNDGLERSLAAFRAGQLHAQHD